MVLLLQEEPVRDERILPRNLDSGSLREEDECAEEKPESLGNLLEVVDGRSRDLRIKEEGRAFNLLSHEEPERREHGNAAVGDLDVGIALCLGFVDAVEEAKNVDAVLKRSTTLLFFLIEKNGKRIMDGRKHEVQ